MSSRARDGVPLWLAIVTSAIGGVANAMAFPALGWWPLAFVGTALTLFALVRRRLWSSLLVGLVGGFAFWGVHIFWLTVYLGPIPWLALAGLQAVFFAIGCVLIALAWRHAERHRWVGWLHWGALPTIVAALWTLRETVTSIWPYGGFSWGRLAFSQAQSPYGDLVAWIGVSGLSFLIAWVAALAVQSFRASGSARGRRGVLVPVGLTVAMLVVPSFEVEPSGSMRIAAVQGDSDAGLFAEYTPGEILADHLAATVPIYGEDVDLVVWPENASDLNPLEYREAASVLDRVTAEMDAPLVVGTITTDGDRVFNSMLLWTSGNGAVDQYDKIHPVPFAEYIPDRDFWYPLAPDLLSLIPRDYTIGTRDNVFAVDPSDDEGSIEAGLATCFDIVDDGLIRQMVDDGAAVILAPTNNADFGRSDESIQQLAIARIRALETGRAVINTSTVGVSAMIGPDGRDIDRLTPFEPGAMVEEIPLSRTRTPAMSIGHPLELTIVAAGILGLGVLLGGARFGRRRATGD